LVALAFVHLPEDFERVARAVAFVICLFLAGVWGSIALQAVLESRLAAATGAEPDPARRTVAKMLALAARALLWTALVLVALDNFGVNITTLIAGLGGAASRSRWRPRTSSAIYRLDRTDPRRRRRRSVARRTFQWRSYRLVGRCSMTSTRDIQHWAGQPGDGARRPRVLRLGRGRRGGGGRPSFGYPRRDRFPAVVSRGARRSEQQTRARQDAAV
jgi:hypothetical protein